MIRLTTMAEPRTSEPGRHVRPDGEIVRASEADHQHGDDDTTGCPRCWPGSYAREHARRRADQTALS